MTALVKGENYTASADEQVLVTSDTGTWTITLPASPTTGDKVSVWDCGDNAGSNVITVARNGNTINGAAEDFLINMDGGRWDGVYDGTTWEYSYVVQTVQPTNTIEGTETVTLTANGTNPSSGATRTTGGPANEQEVISLPNSGSPRCNAVAQIPADWDGTTLPELRILWSPTSTNTGTARFYCTISPVIEGQTITEPSIAYTLTRDDAGLGVADDMQIADWVSMGATANPKPVAGDWVSVSFQRVADAAEDTFTGNAEFYALDLRWSTSKTLQAATAISNTASMVTRTATGTTDTILATDNGKTLIYTNAAAVAVTLPDGLPVDFQCTIMQYGAGAVTVTPNTDTVNGAGTGVSPAAQYDSLYLGKVEATGWVAVS
jgi:hypothetical protein